MSEIPCSHFQMENWAIFFVNFLYNKIWNIMYLTFIPKFGIEDSVNNSFFCFLFFFFHPKESRTLFEILIFLLNYELFCPSWSYKDTITKMYPKYFNGKLWPYHLSCFINSFLYDPAYIRLGFLKSLPLS